MVVRITESSLTASSFVTMPISQSQSGILVFLGVAAVASLFVLAAEARQHRTRNSHPKTGRAYSQVEQYVAKSIRVNMPPARRMGITVDQVLLRSKSEDEGSVSLCMPIKGNTNIHGTAFAGSLYSLCVLSAWYNLVCHLRDTIGDDALEQLTVVAQSAEIFYKKPIWNVKANEYIAATSFLQSGNNAWEGFLSVLSEEGKITCGISGEICIPAPKKPGSEKATTVAVKAVEFKALLCVMLPR